MAAIVGAAGLRPTLAAVEAFRAGRIHLLVATTVVEVGVEPPPGVALKPIAKVVGWGPPAEVIELDLLDKSSLVAFLRGVGLELALALPPGDRERLRRALRHLGESEMVRTGPAENVRRISEPAPSAPLTQTPGLKRLSLMEQRLRRGVAAGAAAQLAHRRVVSQAIAVAATEARNAKSNSHRKNSRNWL